VKADKNNFITEYEVSEIISNSNLNLLLSSFLLNIKKKKDIVIVCPVGDVEELKNFAKYLKNSGISKLADVVFVYKKGLDFVPLEDISALHIKEKIPLGTAGAFFAAAYAGYSLGYKIIAVTDIDAFIDSKESFSECVKLAKKENKVVFPLCTSQEDSNPQKTVSYGVNGFAFYPRSVFEKAGFYTPYMWRGGEDYDFMSRLNKTGLLLPLTDIFIYHPRAGYTVFHKMAEKKKFYPYVAGLMKVFLFHSERSVFALLKFFTWFMFYAFFGDVFSDKDLLVMLSKCNQFTTEYNFTDQISKVEIKRVKERAAFPSSFFDKVLKEPKLLISLLFFKEARIYTDEIKLKISRVELFAGIIKALFLAPFRFVQAILAFIKWKKERRKVVYPVNVKNANEAIKIFADIVNKNLSNIQN